MKINILDVHIDNFSRSDVLNKVRQFLHDGGQHKIFTPNPEMLVLASRDKEFMKILQSADILVPDGFGLILVSHLLGRPFRERVTGAHLVEEIFRLVIEESRSIFLLGGAKGVGKKVAEKLKSENINLSTQGESVLGGKPEINWLDGIRVDEHTRELVLKEINNKNPDILFVALGQGKQERFIYDNLSKMPSVRVALGVGGVFDFISGQVCRAPQSLQKFGLEWLWRLVFQPWRFLRILNAVIIFPIKVFLWKQKSIIA